MSNMVKDLFRLRSLQRAKLIAGKAGIYRPVSGATILEMTEMGRDDASELLMHSLKPDEMMITALYNIKDDVEKQYNMVQTLCELRAAGLIVFYYGRIVKAFDPKILALCDGQDFPLIVLEYVSNKDVAYADVLNDIFSLRKHGDESFFRTFINKIWKIRQDGGTVQDALCHIAQNNGVEIAVVDQASGNVLAATMERTAFRGFLAENAAGLPDSANRFEGQVGDLTWYGQRHYTDCLETQIFLFVPEKKLRKAEEVERIFSFIKLCIDFWRRELVLTHGDMLIGDIVQGNLQSAHVDLEYYRQPEPALWHFWVYDSRMPAKELLRDAKAQLRGEAVTYVAGTFDRFSVVLYSRKKTQAGSVLNILMEDGLKPYSQCQMIHAEGIPTEKEMFRLLQLAVRQYPSILSLFQYRQQIGRFDLIEVEACRDAAGDEAVWDRVQQLLKPLIDYDKKRQGKLLDTLSIFLIDCNRDYRRAAGILYTHPNTVQYRIKKAAELLDISYEQTSALSGIYHALCLYRQNQKKISFKTN